MSAEQLERWVTCQPDCYLLLARQHDSRWQLASWTARHHGSRWQQMAACQLDSQTPWQLIPLFVLLLLDVWSEIPYFCPLFEGPGRPLLIVLCSLYQTTMFWTHQINYLFSAPAPFWLHICPKFRLRLQPQPCMATLKMGKFWVEQHKKFKNYTTKVISSKVFLSDG